jgi:hypothetical protein
MLKIEQVLKQYSPLCQGEGCKNGCQLILISSLLPSKISDRNQYVWNQLGTQLLHTLPLLCSPLSLGLEAMSITKRLLMWCCLCMRTFQIKLDVSLQSVNE